MTHPSSHADLSRRAALLGLLTAPLACRSGAQHALREKSGTGAQRPVLSAAAPPSAPSLDVVQVTQMRAEQRGGAALILLHGYGAQGDDLTSLARSLLRPGARFILPAAPLRLDNGGRAWWRLDAPGHPAYVTDESSAPAPAPNAELDAARGAVQAVLRRTLELFAPEQIALIGFSQGAMLALDVALAGAPAVQRVAVLSGALLADAAARSSALTVPPPAVFISHGREDTRLPFSGAERMKAELEQRGMNVTWRPFSGGHQIPDAVVSELRAFLFG